MNTSAWKVIVVEDTYDDSQLISKILEYNGIKVYAAKNGNECLNLLQQVEPTMIVTDLAMPEKDGWQTLVAVRSNSQTAHVLVVAVTAYHSADIAEGVLQAGFDGYFPNPLDPQSFVHSLRQIAEA